MSAKWPRIPPLLLVKKTGGGYRQVQDLRAISKVAISLHPVFPNPYTLFQYVDYLLLLKSDTKKDYTKDTKDLLQLLSNLGY